MRGCVTVSAPKTGRKRLDPDNRFPKKETIIGQFYCTVPIVR